MLDHGVGIFRPGPRVGCYYSYPNVWLYFRTESLQISSEIFSYFLKSILILRVLKYPLFYIVIPNSLLRVLSALNN